MPLPAPHCDLSAIDFSKVVADLDAIRQVLPHRFDFEMLTAIVAVDPAQHLVVGYRDIRHDEFWTKGHFPGNPIFPGVLMCEAAAQLCAYYTISQKITAGVLMGLGGVENTRFRKLVRPGDRLVLVGKGVRVRSRYTQFDVQGYTDGELCFHSDAIGVPVAKLGEQ
jgi:3-hydroxyacyl-[acyl-carrier-protein] dehydratase